MTLIVCFTCAVTTQQAFAEADLNHDGKPEVFVTDMLPEPEERFKTKTAFDSWDRYQQKVTPCLLIN